MIDRPPRKARSKPTHEPRPINRRGGARSRTPRPPASPPIKDVLVRLLAQHGVDLTQPFDAVLPGVTSSTRRHLHQVGIFTLGQLAAALDSGVVDRTLARGLVATTAPGSRVGPGVGEAAGGIDTQRAWSAVFTHVPVTVRRSLALKSLRTVQDIIDAFHRNLFRGAYEKRVVAYLRFALGPLLPPVPTLLTLAMVPGLGSAAQRRLRAAILRLVADAPPDPSTVLPQGRSAVAGLVERALNFLPENDRAHYRIQGRLVQGTGGFILRREVGPDQRTTPALVARLQRRLVPIFGAEARALLAPLGVHIDWIGTGEPGWPDRRLLLHRDVCQSVLGESDLTLLRLVFRLAGETSPWIWLDEFLVRLRPTHFDQVLRVLHHRVRQAQQGHGGYTLDLLRMDLMQREGIELDVTALGRLLHLRWGVVPAPDGKLLLPERRSPAAQPVAAQPDPAPVAPPDAPPITLPVAPPVASEDPCS